MLQIIDGQLYRESECHFPARCAGVEHYLTALAAKMPDLELALNTRDWPQINQAWNHPKAPVFSFSKVLRITFINIIILNNAYYILYHIS